MKPLLFVFAKAPLMGTVKTRLAAGIGRVHALRIYRSMCAQIFKKCTDPRWHTVLYVTPDKCEGENYGGLWPQNLQIITQGDGGLSERLARMFSHPGPIIAIGTDTPQIKTRDIAAGFKALKTAPAVFGPAADGGFWLIGLNGPVRPEVFENIRWSHKDTLEDMLANIDGRVARLHTLNDVDDKGAYELLKVRTLGRR